MSAALPSHYPTALIAEDEPLLAQALARELQSVWPALQIVASVGDGLSAVREALRLLPNVLFFDVRMPGLSGLDAAADIADQWPQHTALPQLVFITAYDEYAVQAFEHAAVDYLLKPLQTARLVQSLERIRPIAQGNAERAAIKNEVSHTPGVAAVIAVTAATAADTAAAAATDANALDQLRYLLSAQSAAHSAQPVPRLQRLQASVGSSIVMVPISDVLVLQAADKYVRVLTAHREFLIRTPIKDLLPQLDPDVFWQIHRSTLVRASAIEEVRRDDTGRLRLHLQGSDNPGSVLETLVVSRLFAHLFKAM